MNKRNGDTLSISLMLLVTAAAFPVVAFAVTLTADQWQGLLHDAKLVIGIFGTFQIFLIGFLANLLWRRIAKNEDKNEKVNENLSHSIADVNQYARHEFRTMDTAVRNSTELLIGAEIRYGEKYDAAKDAINEAKLMRSEIRIEALEHIMRFEKRLSALESAIEQIRNIGVEK